jgi:hypothetical protein
MKLNIADSVDKEAVYAHHDEESSPRDLSPRQDDDNLGCETDFEHLPEGYYYSRFFLGSMMATGLGLWAAVSSFVRYSPSS